MYTGKCLCGTVKYKVHQKIEDIIMCHCSECRRVQGSAFATNGNVKNENFELISGETSLTEFKENGNKSRFFCNKCGAPIFAKVKNNPDYTRIRLGLIEGDIQERVGKHIFINSKANWDILPDDGVPKHKEW
jgi:hypothetical protein